MTTRIRSSVTTGVALASAAAIAASAIVSGSALIPGTSTPVSLSHAPLALTALSDITISGLTNAYWFGWGGYIGTGNGTPDVYYPNINASGKRPVYVSGAAGVAYYVTDEALAQLGPINLDNYFFEVGSYYGGKNSAAAGSAVSALIYVGTSEIFGANSPIGQLAKAVFYYGVPNIANSTIVSLAEQLPTVKIGPVKVGGGILASLYFTGQTPDGSFSSGSTGLPAIASYVSTSITDALPAASGTAVHAAATKTATSAESVSTAIAKTTVSPSGPKLPLHAVSSAARPTTASSSGPPSTSTTVTKPITASHGLTIAGKIPAVLGVAKPKPHHGGS